MFTQCSQKGAYHIHHNIMCVFFYIWFWNTKPIGLYTVSFPVIHEVASSPRCTLCYSHSVLLLCHGETKRLQIQNIWCTQWFLTSSFQLIEWHLMEYSVGFLHDWQGGRAISELTPTQITVKPILREQHRIIDSLAVNIDLEAKQKLKMFICIWWQFIS